MKILNYQATLRRIKKKLRIVSTRFSWLLDEILVIVFDKIFKDSLMRFLHTTETSVNPRNRCSVKRFESWPVLVKKQMTGATWRVWWL